PTWKDALGTLKKNMNDLATTYGKDILLAEVAYPFAPVDQIEGRESMEWPMSPQGQADFLKATEKAMAGVPGGHGLGYVWWYTDSILVPDKQIHIWRQGNEALFDHDGKPLPAMKLLAAEP
ncbi:MAG: Arabinogalactan endo,4-beta-galactosidase, partial [Phycisphaerales bacterium]|nr:Arabinogalactan endo,4-beta-galactosidase [Phycisphaerales bacterium]